MLLVNSLVSAVAVSVRMQLTKSPSEVHFLPASYREGRSWTRNVNKNININYNLQPLSNFQSMSIVILYWTALYWNVILVCFYTMFVKVAAKTHSSSTLQLTTTTFSHLSTASKLNSCIVVLQTHQTHLCSSYCTLKDSLALCSTSCDIRISVWTSLLLQWFKRLRLSSNCWHIPWTTLIKEQQRPTELKMHTDLDRKRAI